MTNHHKVLCKSLRGQLPYWMTTGVTVCNMVRVNQCRRIQVNLEDPDSIAEGLRFAKRLLPGL